MVRLFRHYVSRALLTLLVAEALYLFLAIYVGRSLWAVLVNQSSWLSLADVTPSALPFSVVMIAIMVAMGLYERNLWDGKGDMLLRVVISFLFGMFTMTVIYYLFPDLRIGRTEFTLAVGIAFLGVLSLRFLFVGVSYYDQLKRRVLVLGVGQNAVQVEELAERKKTLGFLIVGYIQMHEDEYPRVPDNRILQVVSNLYDLASEWRIDEIVVAMDDRRKGFPTKEMLMCKVEGIRISNFLSFLERETGKVQLDALHPSHLIFAENFRGALLKRIIKRLFDVIASVFLLALVWPIMLLAALAIWIESGFHGPILYRQTRVGLNGQLFKLVKFRSMHVDAERDGVARWAQVGDSRITRVGAVLRVTRIDELPQLFNVLQGSMSFVGPRPERPQFVARLSRKIPFYSMRHMVNPGITGWAQIRYPYGASDEDAREKLEYDLYYIRNYSFFFDTLILLQTVHTILWSKGAR